MSHDAIFTARAVENRTGFVPSFVSETAGGPVIRGDTKPVHSGTSKVESCYQLSKATCISSSSQVAL